MAPRVSFLLTSCCLAVPSVSFLLPCSIARTHELRSSPNSPDDWFRSESSDIGGKSLQPMEHSAFVNPYDYYGNGNAGMSKAGIRQQQQQPATVRFGGYQKETSEYYPRRRETPSPGTERRPNLDFAAATAARSREPESFSAYQQWKQGDNRPKPGGVPTSVGRSNTPESRQVRSEHQEPAIKRPNIDFAQRNQPTAPQQQPLSAYQKWKQGDNRPKPGGVPTSVGVTSSTTERRPTQPVRTAVEGTMPNGFSSNPDKPGAWFRSEDSVGSETSPNWPNQQLPQKRQRDVPFEGYLTRKFSSTPDEPGAWFQKNNLMEEEQRLEPPSPQRYVQPPQSVKVGQQYPQGERRPNIPTTQSAAKRPEPEVVRRPVIPKMGNQRQPDSRPFPKSPKSSQERRPNKPQERRPNIPTMQKPTSRTSRRSSSQGSSPKTPFPGENQVFQRFSAPPQYQQQLREPNTPPQVMRAQVRERAPDFPQPDFPRTPPPTGAIMPLDPFPPSRPGIGTILEPPARGGATQTLGPAVSYSWDTPVLTGSGGKRYYDPFAVPDEIIQGAGSRKTWETSHHDQTIVEVGSQGRPVLATAQVWQGPGNTPARMTMYSEDGAFRPWRASFQNTNRSGGNSVLDVRNDGPMAFPLDVAVIGKHDGSKGVGKMEKDFVDRVEYNYQPSKYKVTQTVQGQSLKYFNIKRGVAAVHVELFSEGRPMFVQVELWQGPSATKQSAEIYSDNGNDRHWSAIIDIHGQECVIAVRNVGPALVYPIKASVDPILM